MIIVNTTFHIHRSIEQEMLKWIRRAYAGSAIRAGANEQYLLTRILAGDQDTEGESYALHLTFPTLEAASKWDKGVGESLARIMTERWGAKALSFRTYLEIID